MSSLDNLTSKILNDAKEKAEEVIKKAEKNAKEKYDKEIRRFNTKKLALEESATRDRELTSERIKSGASLKARNEKLRAKQTVIDRVIAILKNKLVNLNEEEYITYLKNNIDSSTLNNKKLIVKQEYVNKVKEIYPNANISDTEFASSGFILEENGIQENYTFEVKVDFIRDELEVEISKLLFS